MVYSLIHNELLGNSSDIDNFKALRNNNVSIFWKQDFPMKINVGGQIGVVINNIDTSNISYMAKNPKKLITYCTCDKICGYASHVTHIM